MSTVAFFHTVDTAHHIHKQTNPFVAKPVSYSYAEVQTRHYVFANVYDNFALTKIHGTFSLYCCIKEKFV